MKFIFLIFAVVLLTDHSVLGQVHEFDQKKDSVFLKYYFQALNIQSQLKHENELGDFYKRHQILKADTIKKLIPAANTLHFQHWYRLLELENQLQNLPQRGSRGYSELRNRRIVNKIDSVSKLLYED